VVLDLEGMGMDHIYPQTAKVYMNLLRILQDMFPEVARKIFVINAPSLFPHAYNLVKPAVAEKTRERVRVYGSNYAAALCAELGAENVYPHWGGFKKAARGSEKTGNLRMGGRPPDFLRYLADNNPHHMGDCALTKLNVPARSRRVVRVECRAHQTLRWFFHTSSDIDFSVEFHGADAKADDPPKEPLLVVPKFRLHTDYVPEYNAVRCRHTGTYALCFDNTYSTFFSKDIRFHVHCVDENHNTVGEETVDTVDVVRDEGCSLN